MRWVADGVTLLVEDAGDDLNTPLHIPEGREFGAALGAARLAMIAQSGASVEEVMTPPATAEVIMPDIGQVAAYDAAYAQFRKLYPAFKSLSS